MSRLLALNHFSVMNTAFTILSKLLAIQSLALLPFFLFTAIFPPNTVPTEFPPPLGYSGDERKIVHIPCYPSAYEFGFLIAVYISGIVFLYPFTKNAADNGCPLVLYLGIFALMVQIIAAVGWSGIEPNWLAAGHQYGLWHSKIWSGYYMSFIITGALIGISLLSLGVSYVWTATLTVVPIAKDALRNAYAPFIAW